jgi:hypothetical protein
MLSVIYAKCHTQSLYAECHYQVGKEVGAEMIGRCQTPNDHPHFIDALVDIVQATMLKNFLRP